MDEAKVRDELAGSIEQPLLVNASLSLVHDRAG